MPNADDPFDNWDQLEETLAQSVKRDGSAGAARSRLAEIFEDEEIADLQRLASQKRLFRSRGAPLGNIVFLHGITGADLGVVKAGGDDCVWVSPLHLMAGRISDLQLNPEATKDAKAGIRVRPIGVNKRYYAKAVLSLRARWNVEPYAYDWRRDINEASDGLAELIRKRFPNQPVHLVAHSMGGLVARNFILRHAQLWEAMRDAELHSGGRLIMLGTPNYGSFSIPPVLTGGDQLMEVLQWLDLKHNMPEILAVTNTFLGTYMLLPSPSKLSTAQMKLYQKETWGNVPGISQRHLDRTYQFYKDLENGPTIDPIRMIYVAGARCVTIDSMSILAPGEFEYRMGFMGDGRVPHELGVLPGVPTYYVEEVHGDLARNEKVLLAVDELLLLGKTGELVSTPLRSRAVNPPKLRDYRTPAERRLLGGLEQVATRAREAGPQAISQDDLRFAADALVKAALGTSTRAQSSVVAPVQDAGELASGADRSRAQIPLKVAVRFGDVTQIKAPVVVVGHYRGVEPVNAIGAIDKAMGGWISRAVKRGMISGQLGETFYVPSGGRVKADGVVVAGMGDYGQFSPIALRRLMANVAIGSAALGLTSLSTVLVGAGEGAMDRDTALKELLEGLGAGLTELHNETLEDVPLKQVFLIERDPARFFLLLEKLRAMSQTDALSTVRLTVVAPKPEEEALARKADKARDGSTGQSRQQHSASSPAFEEIRIAVEWDEGKSLFRFSALTKRAVVPVREVVVSPVNAREAASALRGATSQMEQARYGRLLYTYLMPADFQELMDGTTPVRLIVDSTTASYPWEMACFVGNDAGSKLRWLGTDLGLSRQFKTLLSSAPGGFTPPLNDSLRVLVIADPAPEPHLQLPGARKEGRRLVEFFKSMNGHTSGGNKIEVHVEHRIGSGECEPIEIYAMLLSGDYDIVHFSGHGDYNSTDPKKSGWVFSGDRTLTAVDIFRARKVPRLVFANACFSGVVRESSTTNDPDMLDRGLASIAEAFLERGVPNYIGTGWPVDDEQAVKVAELFYKGLMNRQGVGPSLQQARQAVFLEGFGSSWGAYQLYGDPGDTIVRRDGSQPRRLAR